MSKKEKNQTSAKIIEEKNNAKSKLNNLAIKQVFFNLYGFDEFKKSIISSKSKSSPKKIEEAFLIEQENKDNFVELVNEAETIANLQTNHKLSEMISLKRLNEKEFDKFIQGQKTINDNHACYLYYKHLTDLAQNGSKQKSLDAQFKLKQAEYFNDPEKMSDIRAYAEIFPEKYSAFKEKAGFSPKIKYGDEIEQINAISFYVNDEMKHGFDLLNTDGFLKMKKEIENNPKYKENSIQQLFADLNQETYSKYEAKKFSQKQFPSIYDFYSSYERSYPDNAVQKKYAQNIYALQLGVGEMINFNFRDLIENNNTSANTEFKQNLISVKALTLLNGEEFVEYANSHKFVLDDNNPFSEYEKSLEFYDEQQRLLKSLESKKQTPKVLEEKRAVTEKLTVAQNYAKYLTDKDFKKQVDDYAKAHQKKEKYEDLSASISSIFDYINNPENDKANKKDKDKQNPEVLKIQKAFSSQIDPEVLTRVSFYTEEKIIGKVKQTEDYVNLVAGIDTNGISAYADFYKNRYERFARDRQSGFENVQLDSDNSKIAFYLKNGGSLKGSSTQGVEYFKDNVGNHNLIFKVDTNFAPDYITFVKDDNDKFYLKTGENDKVELMENNPIREVDGKVVAFTKNGNFELNVSPRSCDFYKELINFPTEVISAGYFSQIDEKTFNSRQQNLANVSRYNVATFVNEYDFSENLLFKGNGGVEYYFLPYQKDSGEVDYLRVMKKDGQVYLNLKDAQSDASTYELTSINQKNGQLLVGLQKDGFKNSVLPVNVSNTETLDNLSKLLDAQPVNFKTILQETRCPYVENFEFDEVPLENNEIQSTKIQRARAGQTQTLKQTTYKTLNGEVLTGFSQEIKFASTLNVEGSQNLSMLSGKTDLLFAVAEEGQPVAEFIKQEDKIQLKMPKQYVDKFAKANPSIILGMSEDKDTCIFDVEKILMDQKGTITISAAGIENAFNFSAFGTQIKDKTGNTGALKSDKILDFYVSTLGYQALKNNDNQCELGSRSKNIDDALSIAYINAQRPGQNRVENLLTNSNVELYSIPLKNPEKEGYLNLKIENGKKHVYFNNGWYEIQNASFNESTLSRKESDPALHFDIDGIKGKTNIYIPLSSYQDNSNSISALTRLLPEEFDKMPEGLNYSPKSVKREIDDNGEKVQIKAYRRTGDSTSTMFESLDNVGSFAYYSDKANNLVEQGHPVENILDPVSRNVRENGNDNGPDNEHNDEADRETAPDNPSPRDERENEQTNQPDSPAPAAETASEKSSKKDSEVKEIVKSLLMPFGLMAMSAGLLCPPLLFVGTLMVGSWALNTVVPGWTRIFRRKTAEEKESQLKEDYAFALSRSKQDLAVSNQKLSKLEKERNDILNDPRISDSKKQSKIKKLTKDIEEARKEVSTINSRIKFMEHRDDYDKMEKQIETDRKNIKQAESDLKKVEKANKQNLKEFEKADKNAREALEIQRENMKILAKDANDLRKLKNERGLTKKEEERLHEIEKQLQGADKDNYAQLKEEREQANEKLIEKQEQARVKEDAMKSAVEGAKQKEDESLEQFTLPDENPQTQTPEQEKGNASSTEKTPQQTPKTNDNTAVRGL